MYHILVQNSDIIIIVIRVSRYKVAGECLKTKLKFVSNQKKSEVLLHLIKVDENKAKCILHQGCSSKGRECNQVGLEEILI